MKPTKYSGRLISIVSMAWSQWFITCGGKKEKHFQPKLRILINLIDKLGALLGCGLVPFRVFPSRHDGTPRFDYHQC